MKTIKVITWKYKDGPGSGLVRAYAAPDHVDEDLELFQKFITDRELAVEEVQFVEGKKAIIGKLGQ